MPASKDASAVADEVEHFLNVGEFRGEDRIIDHLIKEFDLSDDGLIKIRGEIKEILFSRRIDRLSQAKRSEVIMSGIIPRRPPTPTPRLSLVITSPMTRDVCRSNRLLREAEERELAR